MPVGLKARHYSSLSCSYKNVKSQVFISKYKMFILNIFTLPKKKLETL